MKRSLRSWLWRVPLEQRGRRRDRPPRRDAHARARRARRGSGDRARSWHSAGSATSRSLKRTMTTLGRKRDRDMRLTQWLDELRDDLKFAIRQLKGSPALHAGGDADAGARHRRQQRDLRARRRHAAATAAVWRARSPGRDLGNDRDHPAQLRVAAQHGRLEARSRTFEKIAGFTPSVGGMVMAGADGNAETVSRQWVTAGHLRRARRHADCRPDVLRGRRGQARERRRDERVVLARAVQRRPGRRGPRAPARRNALHRRGHRARRTSS